MRTSLLRCCTALALLASCGAAVAHPGHAEGIAAGMLHPLLGLDHLLAMAAVGIWAAQLGGRARWALPASFVTLMALAGAAGMAGRALPMVESGIATSVLLLGLLIAFSVTVTPMLGAAIVAVFAVFHGYAHGAEMPATASAWQFAAGFMLATAALHGLGLLIGLRGQGQARWLRATGAVVAASGLYLMASL